MKHLGLAFLTLFFACAERSPAPQSTDGGVTIDGARFTTADAPPSSAPDGNGAVTPDSGATATADGGNNSNPDGALGTVCGTMSCTPTQSCCATFAGGQANYACQDPAASCGGATVSCDGPEDCAGGVCCGSFNGQAATFACSPTCQGIEACHNDVDCPQNQMCCPPLGGSSISYCSNFCF